MDGTESIMCKAQNIFCGNKIHLCGNSLIAD